MIAEFGSMSTGRNDFRASTKKRWSLSHCNNRFLRWAQVTVAVSQSYFEISHGQSILEFVFQKVYHPRWLQNRNLCWIFLDKAGSDQSGVPIYGHSFFKHFLCCLLLQHSCLLPVVPSCGDCTTGNDVTAILVAMSKCNSKWLPPCSKAVSICFVKKIIFRYVFAWYMILSR